ncbi:hypothetical protein E4T66_07330 [Sinimarinibacterium sp. CAU 1509]|nr:hypothetical protein E4T66_07330 [Sinimarinibacterium sp. CAU 1509]
MLAMIAGMLVLTRTVDLHWHTHLADPLSADHPVPLVYLANASVPHLANDQDVDTAVVGDEAGKPDLRTPRDTPRKPIAFLTETATDLAIPQFYVRFAGLQPRQTHVRRLHRSVLRPPLRAPPL